MLIDLPDFCAARHPVSGEPVIIRRGEMGYAPWPSSLIDPDEYNRRNDIDEAVIETMVACSMTGRWDAADVVSVRRSIEKGKERVARDGNRTRSRWSED
jgi:hypothetical protein